MPPPKTSGRNNYLTAIIRIEDQELIPFSLYYRCRKSMQKVDAERC